MRTLKVTVKAQTDDDVLMALETIIGLVRQGYTSTIGYEGIEYSLDGDEEEPETEEA